MTSPDWTEGNWCDCVAPATVWKGLSVTKDSHPYRLRASGCMLGKEIDQPPLRLVNPGLCYLAQRLCRDFEGMITLIMGPHFADNQHPDWPGVHSSY